jgi:cytochrome P450
VKDPHLFRAVREEVSAAECTTDASPNKVTSLPLLQPMFIEILLLHVNFDLMRSVNEPVELDGITLPTGSLVQAPMKVANFDELVWGRPKYTASEFWAEQHVRIDEDSKRTFRMAGRPRAYLPFGTHILLLDAAAGDLPYAFYLSPQDYKN